MFLFDSLLFAVSIILDVIELEPSEFLIISVIVSVSFVSALSTAFSIIFVTALSDNSFIFSSKFSCFAKLLTTFKDKFDSVFVLSIVSKTLLAVSLSALTIISATSFVTFSSPSSFPSDCFFAVSTAFSIMLFFVLSSISLIFSGLVSTIAFKTLTDKVSFSSVAFLLTS